VNDRSWTCPYCNQVATLQKVNTSFSRHQFNNENKDGLLGLSSQVIVCPNSKCKQYVITALLYKLQYNPQGDDKIIPPALETWNLKPASSAKPFPDYIPAAILADYKEACLIVALSPKASATLARRCLQGMIRDFWGIKKARLIDEINALEGKTDSTTWAAIDAVRKIGNVGAHMEKDIDVIIDVEPQEAQLLIGLIEVLLDEWYVHRHEREQHMQKVIAAAQAKANPLKPA
jgi:hypothetical protein